MHKQIDTVCGKDKSISVSFPDPDNLMKFKVTICPDSGYWKGGRFVFSVAVLKSYPHDAPKVHCDTKVYHPNIDLQGAVCLNILRDDWKPIMNLNQVILGLQFLFMVCLLAVAAACCCCALTWPLQPSPPDTAAA